MTFRVRTMYGPKLGCVVITKLISEHTACVGTDLGNRRNVSKHEYLREVVPTITVLDRDTTPKDINKAVQHKLHHKVSYKAARKVLRSLQGTNIEAEREQFRHMGALVEVMKQTDPEGDFFLSVDPITVRFPRSLCLPSASCSTFQDGCLPIIALDGTFTKNKF